MSHYIKCAKDTVHVGMDPEESDILYLLTQNFGENFDAHPKNEQLLKIIFIYLMIN